MYRVRLGEDRYRIIFRIVRTHRIVTMFRVRTRTSAYPGIKNNFTVPGGFFKHPDRK